MDDFDISPQEEIIQTVNDEIGTIKRRLTELKDQIDSMQTSVDREQGRYSNIATELRSIKENIDTVPREDLRDKYEEGLDVRFRLATMRGQLEKFEATYDLLLQQQDLLTDMQSKLQSFEMSEQGSGGSSGGVGNGSLDVVGIIRAQEDERQRLARAMHDGPAQSLTNFILQTEIVQKIFTRYPDRAGDELGKLKTDARFAAGHHLWLRAMATIVEGGVPADELMAEVTKAAAEPEEVALRRARVRLVFQSGQGDQALELLSQARRQDPEHVGLAADEVFYNALLGQRYGGVADIADQLTAKFQPAKRDLAHTRLARAVVHVHSGEAEPARALLRQAWPDLPGWEKPARAMALETSLLAGDVELTREILEGGDIDPAEVGIYQAWLDLIDGDVMKSLAALAELDQAHPKVALLQGLALVEQARWDEAKPWLERADTMLPGRVDVEVARARVEAQVGDPEQALRKLEALSEEEPFAPRAWTGLGEAISAVYEAGKGRSIREAQRAFRKAIEREALPAEALLRLAELLDQQRTTDGESAAEALEALEKAVKINDHFPRYSARLGMYLLELGFWERAVEVLEPLPERQAVAWPEVIALIHAKGRVADDLGQPAPDMEGLLEQAKELGAPAREINIERARLALQADEGGAKRAVEILTPLVDADPEEIEGRVLLARAMVKQFDREEAVRMLRRGIQGAERDGRLFLEWASIESRSGTKRSATLRARSAWKSLLEEDQPPYVLMDAAKVASRIFQRTDDDKYGLALGRELSERVPYQSEVWRLRATLQLQAGNTSDASRSAQRALELDEDNPLAHEVTGHCLLRFGHKDQARAAYKKAVELAKGTPDEGALRDNLRRL